MASAIRWQVRPQAPSVKSKANPRNARPDPLATWFRGDEADTRVIQRLRAGRRSCIL
jgi:hypothetical protein